MVARHLPAKIQSASAISNVDKTKLAMLVMLWLIPASIFLCTLKFGWVSTWSALGVPSFTPAFLDLRVISSGLFTMQHGGDPLVANPFDPLGRALNYPRIWLVLFAFLHISDRAVPALGIFFCVLFLGCISKMIVELDRTVAALILLSTISLASLFAFERGNTDLLIFALVFLACIARNNYAKFLLLAVGATLKIYPIFGAFVRASLNPAKERRGPLLLSSVAVAILALQWRDLRLIAHSTPVATFDSFGVLTLRELAVSYAARLDLLTKNIDLFRIGVVIGLYLIAVLAIFITWLKAKSLGRITTDRPREAELFALFGSLYAFCFALGSNWDYRFILLIPTVPFAFHLLGHHLIRGFSITYLFAVLISMNAMLFKMSYGAIVTGAASYLVFLFIVAVVTLQVRDANPRSWPRGHAAKLS
jgi:hypothetical protein